jgi:Zn-finger nucleic acid-binding protein
VAYRESFESCPRCGVALEDAGDVRACNACRGQWVLEPVLAEMVMAMLPAGVLGRLTLVPSAQRKEPTACPSCGVQMESVIMYGVEIERCPKDHGVWFDPEELQTGLLRSAANPARSDSMPETPEPQVPQPPAPAQPLAPASLRKAEPTAAPSKLDAAPEAGEIRRAASPIVTDEIVWRMKSGVQFRVGRDEYWWDAAQGELMVRSSGRSHAISQAQWRQVVASHPEAFSGMPAMLAEVIARMKRGEEFQYGGGRIFDVFGWDADRQQLYVESVVDGYRSRDLCSESRLAEAIAEAPHLFAK